MAVTGDLDLDACAKPLVVEPNLAQRLAAVMFSRGDGVWSWPGASSITRICVHDNRVAWVHCSSVNVFLADRLAVALDCELGQLRCHLAQCRGTGRRLGEYLADSGLITRASLRQVLCLHMREHLAAFVNEASSEPSDFEPRADRYERSLTFELHEILLRPGNDEAVAANDGPVALQRGFSGQFLLERVLGIDGVRGAALVDFELECCVAARSHDVPRVEIAAAGEAHVPVWRAALEASKRIGGVAPREVLFESHQSCDLLCPVEGTTHFVMLSVDTELVAPALAAYLLRKVVASHLGR